MKVKELIGGLCQLLLQLFPFLCGTNTDGSIRVTSSEYLQSQLAIAEEKLFILSMQRIIDQNIIKITWCLRVTSALKDTSVDLVALGVSCLASDVVILPLQSATSAPASAPPLSPPFPPPSLHLAWHPAEPPSHSVALASQPPAESYFAAPSQAVGSG